MKSFTDSMHVLGLEDCSDGNQNLVYEEFKEQLVLCTYPVHSGREPSILTSQQAWEFEALRQPDEKIGEAARHVAKV